MGGDRAMPGWRRPAAVSLALLAASLNAGCYLFRSDAVETIAIRDAGLTPEEAARKSEEADRLYEAPRTAARVEASFQVAFDSASASNGYRGLWQAARAAAWLAESEADKGRAEIFARKGVAIGREAARLAPGGAESWYFLALNLARLSDLRRTPRFVQEMAAAAEKALTLDRTCDRAGPDRFLGLLNLNTEGNPVVGYGDFDKALEHLRRAAELYPDAENRLAYAQALVADDEYGEARKQLDAAIAAKAPAGLEAEHEGWVKKARELREKIEGK